jgi:hypothetical protein
MGIMAARADMVRIARQCLAGEAHVAAANAATLITGNQ